MNHTATISDRQFEIIGAAGKILTASGVGGLTIKNLAKEMNFSESAIYRHFSSKEEIIIVMLDYLATNMEARYAQLSFEHKSAAEKLTLLFQNQFSYFKLNPHFVVAVFSDGLLEESQGINQTILKNMAIKVKHLSSIVAEGQQTKEFRDDIPAEELIHLIMGSFRLLMFKWRVSNFHFNIETHGNKLIQSVLTLIKPN